jgi:hypothetical protein
MSKNKYPLAMRLLVAVTFLVMIAVNALANILPINGQSTGAVSDAYGNLFAPAALTFAVWGLIYLLLAAFTFAQFGFLSRQKNEISAEALNRIGLYFSLSSIANAIWIISWHYEVLPVSMVLMLVILVCLIMIILEMKKENARDPFTWRDTILLGLPFSVYFGWITVATIANATTLLVSWGWNGFGLSETVWTVIILVVGMLIGLITMLRNKDIPYGLVLVWAYAGILIKHTSPAPGFDSKYLWIIGTVAACLVIFLTAEIYLVLAWRKKA